jgi:hypothetical protein
MPFRSQRPPPRRAVVTGASSGIGAAFARALEGADLLLTGRDAVALEGLAGELRGDGREVRVVTADLAKPAELGELIAAAAEFAPDLLVNDAGLGTWGAFLEDPPRRVEQQLLVDVAAPVALARALLPEMIERAEAEGGRCGLINLSSALAFTPVPYGAVYGASKAFVLSFTEALAAELARHPVDVLAVCPNAVRTDFFRRAGFPDGPLPGAIEPEQVARRALADLGRVTVGFSDVGTALVLKPVAVVRVGLARTLGLGLGAWRSWRGRDAPETPAEPAPAPSSPPQEQPPPQRPARARKRSANGG